MWFAQSLTSTSYNNKSIKTTTPPTENNNNNNIINNNMTKTLSNDDIINNGISSSQSYDSLSNLDFENSDTKSTSSSSSFNNINNNNNNNKHQRNGSTSGSTTGSGGNEQYETIKIGNGSISAIISLEESTKERANFITKLKNPKAHDIRKSLLDFVLQFANKGPGLIEEQGHTVITYARELEHWILSLPLWANAGEAEIEGIRDGIEKYIMSKLYHCTFQPARLGGLELTEGNIVSEGSLIPTEEDLKLFKHITIHGFLEPQHLDIQQFINSNEQLQNLAMSELRKINTYKTPRDKMVCVYNCCKVIFKLLKSVNPNGNPSGADEFLPILIYVVLKSNPLMLKSNITYVNTFRDQSRMMTEIACYFTHLVSAVSFIENISTPIDLTIEESEFYRLRDKFEFELPLKLNPDILKRLNYKPPTNHQAINLNLITNNNNNNNNSIKSPTIKSTTTANVSSTLPPLPHSRGHSRHSSNNQQHQQQQQQQQQQNFGDIDNFSNNGSPRVSINEQFTVYQDNIELEKRYEFLNYQTDDIKIGQISKLLEDYKKLVIENNILKSKLNSNNISNQNNHSHHNHNRQNSCSYQISEPTSLSSSPALSRSQSWVSNSLPISPNLISKQNHQSSSTPPTSTTPNIITSKSIKEEDEKDEKKSLLFPKQSEESLTNSPTISSSSLLD
ncbi:hypothetical protein RB653_000896 [Dictyostelium firmibasis]|uniref:VPS9 domain-containing protein n=1 Tax=Dictyostelium firmibasis TaxID=79012 RepID=A0AAN7U325_9MYCE